MDAPVTVEAINFKKTLCKPKKAKIIASLNKIISFSGITKFTVGFNFKFLIKNLLKAPPPDKKQFDALIFLSYNLFEMKNAQDMFVKIILRNIIVIHYYIKFFY